MVTDANIKNKYKSNNFCYYFSHTKFIKKLEQQ